MTLLLTQTLHVLFSLRKEVAQIINRIAQSGDALSVKLTGSQFLLQSICSFNYLLNRGKKRSVEIDQCQEFFTPYLDGIEQCSVSIFRMPNVLCELVSPTFDALHA